jgi:hypothetical protein
VAVMKVAVFWNVASCSPYMKQCYEGTCHLHLQGRNSGTKETRTVAGGKVETILNQKIEMIQSSETVVLLRNACSF